MPLESMESVVGRRIDGVLGLDFIRSFTTEIDFERSVVRLYDPERYEYRGKGVRVELLPSLRETVIKAGLAFSEGRIEGAFRIDTGLESAVIVHAPEVIEHGVIEPSADGLRLKGVGLGGQNEFLPRRARSLEIGSVVIKEPVADLALTAGGAFGRSDLAGTIGIRTLARFRVIFDFPRGVLILEPSHRFNVADTYRRVGLALVANPPDFRGCEVRAVSPSSLAAIAGLEVGDHLESVNERPASQLSLPEIRRILRDGSKRARLRVTRNGQSRAIIIDPGEQK